MARTQKYPGINLAAVKKFCRQCVKLNGGTLRKNRAEYAGLVEEDGSYYLTDGYRLVRFRYDLPELEHAEKKDIGGQPGMLRFIDDACARADKLGKSADVELPDIEEVREAVTLNKWAKKHKQEELPIPLGSGRVWVNPFYLLDMMQIFPLQRVVCMTGGAHQPVLFGCDGADGTLMPVRCKNPQGNMELWAKRKAQAEAEAADGPKEPKQRKPKRDNQGQPTSLAQLKKRLTVGAAFEINTVNGDLQRRRVVKAQTNAIVSIVPFDAEHKVTAGGGNWIWFESAAKWAFADGWCKYLGDAKDPDFAIFSIRLLDTTAEEDERYNTWLADLEAQRTAEQERKEADRTAQEQVEKEKQAQEIEDALTEAETAIFERGKRVNNDTIHGKCLVLRLAERYNINVPMRTAGWITKNLASFVVIKEDGKNGIIPSVWQGYKGKNIPQGALNVLFAILRAVDLHFEELAQDSGDDGADMMTDEEVEQFFNGGIVFPHSDSADDTHGADTADSDGVPAAGNSDVPLASVSAKTTISDADKPIYSKYTQNLAGGHNTAPPLNTS